MAKRFSITFLCLICSLVSVSFGSAEEIRGVPLVIDGDTLEVNGKPVRLQGIDAPERGQWCRDAKGARYPCGKIAISALRSHIGSEIVECHVEERDRYNRALGVCSVNQREDLNSWLVSEGHALAYRRYSLRYVTQEKRAREEEAGMWAGELIAPWHWRRGERLGRESAGSALRDYDDNLDGKIGCSEARRHEIAPVYRGEAAYRFMRDGDGNGVVCE